MVDSQLRIVDEQTGEIVSEGMEFSKTGLTLDPRLSYDQWENVGQQLNEIEGAIQWWIGDWLNFGEHKYGELYVQAVEVGANPQDWMDYKWVSNAVETSVRTEVLSWSHHRLIAPLEPEEQKQWLDRAEKEEMSVYDLRHAIKVKKFEDKAGKLPNDKYRVIYADPPWEYAPAQHARFEQKTMLEDHYPTMALEDICNMSVSEITQDEAVLFLWSTSPYLMKAFQVVEAWGFEYKASFVWDKIAHNVGHYNSVRHELLLICTKGSCLPDKRPDGEPYLLDSVQSIMRTEHSKKPEEFRDIIDMLYPSGKRVELFARDEHDGWEVWGNEPGL
jgi:N6-adenosine-specific RNA methylase IME4